MTPPLALEARLQAFVQESGGQVAAARRLGVAQQRVDAWCKGSYPAIEARETLADVLELSDSERSELFDLPARRRHRPPASPAAPLGSLSAGEESIESLRAQRDTLLRMVQDLSAIAGVRLRGELDV